MLSQTKALPDSSVLADGQPAPAQSNVSELEQVVVLIAKDAHKAPREYIRRVDTKQQGE